MCRSRLYLDQFAASFLVLALILGTGALVINTTNAALEEKKFKDCVNHFNTTNFTTEAGHGFMVCVKDEDIYLPSAKALASGNLLGDILTAPLVAVNKIPPTMKKAITIIGVLLVLLVVLSIGAWGPRV